jgi:putative glutathione S-transferase
MWNNKEGEFIRYTSGFRNWIRADGSTPFEPTIGRYHLYISWACPWAHRTALVRSLLGLEKAISLSVVGPVWNERGWTFTDEEGAIPDSVNHKQDLVDIYLLADPKFDGEESTPVLWDRETKTIVNNESVEIIRMFCTEFAGISEAKIDLYPEKLRPQIDEIIAAIYPTVNNGVYRTGFATSQKSYERAYASVFEALDGLEAKLSKSRFLCGSKLTIADLCLFTTLYRFDLVYYAHFKCNQKHVYEYPNLWAYVRDIYQYEGVAKTCFPDHIKRHYYMSQTDINPTRIVPHGPVLDHRAPHGRSGL